jgi:hypothetical protein
MNETKIILILFIITFLSGLVLINDFEAWIPYNDCHAFYKDQYLGKHLGVCYIDSCNATDGRSCGSAIPYMIPEENVSVWLNERGGLK